MDTLIVSIELCSSEDPSSKDNILTVVRHDFRGRKKYLHKESKGRSPSLETVLQLQDKYNKLYDELLKYPRQIELPDDPEFYGSSESIEETYKKLEGECQKVYKELQESLQEWIKNSLPSEELTRILKENPNIPVRISFKTNESRLQQLPLEEACNLTWNLCQRETSFLFDSGRERTAVEMRWNFPLHVLVVVGSGDLDLGKDVELIRKHVPRRSRVTCLLANTECRDGYEDIKGLNIEPLTVDNLNQFLWREKCDIFIFAGHSNTQPDGNDGSICLDTQKNINISIEELKEALAKAVKKRLKLIIFNSCHGMGLARQISTSLDERNLSHPSIIVMRRNILDKVAHVFLDQLLMNIFELKYSIEAAVDDARKHLKIHEKTIPGVTSLPVLFANGLSAPVTVTTKTFWRSLSKRIRFWVRLFISMAIGFLLSIGFNTLSTSIASVADICNIAKNDMNFSCGEKSLLIASKTGKIENMFFSDRDGMNYLKIGEYQKAVDLLSEDGELNKKERNTGRTSRGERIDLNPEIVIAKNNAKALLAAKSGQPFVTIAALLPFPVSNNISNPELRNIASQILAGIAQAQEDWNARHKWNVIIVLAADENSSQLANRVVEEILNSERNVVATVGLYSSTVLLGLDGKSGVLPKFQAAQHVLMSGTTTTTEIPKIARNNDNFFFRVVTDNSAQTDNIMKLLKKKKVRKVVMFHGRGVFSTNMKDRLKESLKEFSKIELQLKPISYEQLQEQEIIKIIDESTAVILCPDAFNHQFDSVNSREIIRLMREGKIHPQLVIGNEAINEPWLLESLRNAPDLANLQGKLFFSLAWNKDVDRQNISPDRWGENAERFELWEDYFGQIAGRTALNYDATNILLQAIDLARIDGITITDPRKIRESLPAKIRKVIDAANRTEKAPWLTGKITFDKWGNREQKLYGLVEPHFKQDKRDGKLLKITFTNPLD